MPNTIRRYRIPDSRLPFVNTELTETRFQGRPHLVSSVVGGAEGGRLYFWDPDSGNRACRPLPRGIAAAYMLRPDAEGRLYLGCSNGDLLRYDPEGDRMVSLVSGELAGITWGGCVTDRYAVWTASPGHVGVYDWRREKLAKVFRPIDSERPEALYGHRVMETPERKVLLAMDVPQARLVTLDTADMTVTSRVPVVLAGSTGSSDAAFLDAATLVLSIGTDLHLLGYPGLEPRGQVAFPGSGTGARTAVVGGSLYACTHVDGSLFRLDRDSLSWELLVPAWTGEDTILGVWRGRDVCAVTVTGIAHRYDPGTARRDRFDLEAAGPMSAHALCPAPGLIVGAPFINQRFWTIDMSTGDGRDCGRAAPGGGQVNQIVWEPLTRRLLMSSYATSSVTAFDPSRPAAWPENPRVLASAQEHEQMRPMGLAHDGRHVWMATSPEYGHLGGALSRIDPLTGEIRVWRNLVVDQKVNALVLDPARGRLFFSTDISADCDSAPPTQTTGRLALFDTASLAVRSTQAIRPDAPLNRVHALLPSGEVLAQAGQELFAWDPDGAGLRSLGAAPRGFREATRDSLGRIWAVADGGVGLLHAEEDRLRFDPVIGEEGRLLRVVENTLYFAVGFDVCSLWITS